MKALALALPLALLVSACAQNRPQEMSDWERANQVRFAREQTEPMPTPPPYPKKADLVEFPVSAASDFRFYVDKTSIAVDRRGVVHYVLAAVSPSGVQNVSYEAMNCGAVEYRVFAIGRSDGTWVARDAGWRPIEPRTVQRWHNELFRYFFCPNKTPIADAAEGARALELGRHPWLDAVQNPNLGGAGN